jgi:hypothetical protein
MVKNNNESFTAISYLNNHSRQVKLFTHSLNLARSKKVEKSENSLIFVSILKNHVVFYYKPILNNSNPISIYYTTYFNTSNTDLNLAIASRYDIYNYYKKNKSGLYMSLLFNFEGRNYKASFVTLSEDQEPIKILELSRMYTKGLFTGNPNCE